MNAVQQLYHYRKSLCTTTFKARGQRVIRCEKCRLSVEHCLCSLAPQALTKITSNASFLLLMYDTEVLKPSNTGKLIADVVENTYAYLWSRTDPNPELLSLINNDKWQPFVVFPAHYAEPEREVVQHDIKCVEGKKPLFIMLDGSWREAKKMFRKSPYLAGFPIASFDPNCFDGENNSGVKSVVDGKQDSRYQIRVASGENQFATAEVAARMLAMMNENNNATILDLWFDVFSFQYQKSVCQTNKGNPKAIEHYQQYIDKLNAT